MIKHIGATLKKLIMLAFGMWSGTMMDDARCGCSDLCFYPLNHQFRWRLLRTKNPRLRIPTLSPEFYDIDFSVSRGQTFAIFLADFMKLFSPELWPQKIQISEATNMSIEIYHLSSENGDKRVVGCQQKKGWVVFQLLRWWLTTCSTSTQACILFVVRLIMSIKKSLCFVGNPSQFFQALLPRFKIYIPCVWWCSLHFRQFKLILEGENRFWRWFNSHVRFLNHVKSSFFMLQS